MHPIERKRMVKRLKAPIFELQLAGGYTVRWEKQGHVLARIYPRRSPYSRFEVAYSLRRRQLELRGYRGSQEAYWSVLDDPDDLSIIIKERTL